MYTTDLRDKWPCYAEIAIYFLSEDKESEGERDGRWPFMERCAWFTEYTVLLTKIRQMQGLSALSFQAKGTTILDYCCLFCPARFGIQ